MGGKKRGSSTGGADKNWNSSLLEHNFLNGLINDLFLLRKIFFGQKILLCLQLLASFSWSKLSRQKNIVCPE